MSNFHLNTTDLQILDFTRLNVQSNSHVVVSSIQSIDPEAELSVTTGTFEMGVDSRADIDGKWSIGQNTTLGHSTLIRVLQPTGLLSVTGGFNFSNASEVSIFNGGDVVGNAFIDIGNTGSSTVSISDAGSTWTAMGTSDWGLALSLGATEAFTVTGANSRFEVTNTLTIGNLGNGNLKILNGGGVTAASVTVSQGSSLVVEGIDVVQSSVDNRGQMELLDSSVTGGVTLRADSQFEFDNATVGMPLAPNRPTPICSWRCAALAT